ncbi:MULTISPECIES: hypothetical protein [Ramlibacter]|uniref:Uncharacterized protein n=1 Tax=Ramlibacter pinisoli TaxID=2682844 RepID=A0A6N8IS67_9BURK|nr:MULTISPECIES: hypothetical protein [Ramlibacter]MBA2964459.1 hypothetical protein [Ramlibacter sp. CGMCC 1.13660]MVQ29425.1 hypothetical protein [Ramlibacter pinisoli]
MTALVANSFSRFIEQVFTALDTVFDAAFAPAARSEMDEMLPKHLSDRAKRLVRADY